MAQIDDHIATYLQAIAIEGKTVKTIGGLKWSVQQCLQSIGWGVVVEGLARARVQSRGDRVEVFLGEARHARPFGKY